MTILDKCKVEETYERYAERQPVKISLMSEQTDVNELAINISHQFGFKMILQIQVEFRANKAQYTDAKKLAERALLHKLYGETLSNIDAISLAIANDDKSMAMQFLSKIRTELIG